ncbi:MAG TPA: M48 family metalloprotease [Rhizomicrobium sp.]|nr:M48 family metalloprotease [Rhizomicrobium sp.]
MFVQREPESEEKAISTVPAPLRPSVDAIPPHFYGRMNRTDGEQRKVQALTYCNPNYRRSAKIVAFLFGFIGGLAALTAPATAQGISLLQDTETERALRSYEDPILKVAGLDPHAVKMYIVNDPSINAFAAEGQNIFVNSGLFIQLKTPNELIGVLAHETGHIAGGHLIRDSGAIQKAMIPMLISMVVGVAAIAAGGGEAGMAIMGLGQTAAAAQFNEFSRPQEATADQMGQRYLRETHQSGEGMVHIFERMANESARAHVDALATDHPADRDRVVALQAIADASPYANVMDTPEAQHEFDMIKAKMLGYLAPVKDVLVYYPPKNQSKPARYARAMAYMRQPNLKMALSEINSLIAEEPNNPYFHEMLGQIYVEMSQPEKGIGPYQKSVDILPDAPELRVSLAAAQLATEKKALAQPAIDNLKIALDQDSEDVFAWYEAAQAYSMLGNQPMADLATAERYYNASDARALVFAERAEKALEPGSSDWQRANDIVAIVKPLIQNQRR